jgi:hypothetical protein
MSAIPEVLVREHKSGMQGTTRIPSKIAARACKNKKAAEILRLREFGYDTRVRSFVISVQVQVLLALPVS